MDSPRTPGSELVPEERAREIWRRAARLQAEAADRLEERSHALARKGAVGAGDGYRLADIESAAVDAGIAPEFVRLALAESAGRTRRGRRLSPRLDRACTRLLGTDRRSVEASMVIAAPPAAVLEAMQRLFPQHPYRLELRDSIGDDPLDGAVLVFATPGYVGTANDFALDMAYADIKELHVVIRPVRSGSGVTAAEVTMTSDLEHGRRVNLWVGGGAVASGAAGGAMGLGALALGGGITLALAALPAAAGAVLGGGLFAGAYRALYRWGMGRGIEALDRLLHALDVNTRTRGAFVNPPPAEREPGPA